MSNNNNKKYHPLAGNKKGKSFINAPGTKLFIITTVFILIVLFFSPITAAFSNFEKEAARVNLENLREEYDLQQLDSDHELAMILTDLQEIVGQEKPELDFTLHFAETDVINGLYVGDGNIVLFSGLVEMLNRDEKAALIAHEMGHGVEGHLDEKFQRNIGFTLGRLILDNIIGEDIASGRLYRIFVNTTLRLMDRGFSREQEREADLFAVELLHESEYYNVQGMIGLLEKLVDLRGNRPPQLLEIFNSHPDPEERLEYSQEKITELAE